MRRLSANAVMQTIARYQRRYRRWGRTPKALGWHKGKQDVRFEVLTSAFDCRGKRILDVGCGFGDLFEYLLRRDGPCFSYVGIDLVNQFVEDAMARHEEKGARFIRGEFLSHEFDDAPDIVIASGLFNHRLKGDEAWEFAVAVIQKAFRLCREAVAVDFLSDRVDFRCPGVNYSDPVKALELGYQLSRNLLLRNDYMPFEFALLVFRDDSFSKSDTLFRRYRRESKGMRARRSKAGRE